MATDYPRQIITQGGALNLVGGDTVTGTNTPAITLWRNTILDLDAGAGAPITINSSGTNGHGIWANTSGVGAVAGTSITFGPGVTTNITTNGDQSEGILLGGGTGANVVFSAGSTTNINAYLGMLLSFTAIASPALVNTVTLQDGSIVNINSFLQPGIFQGLSMSGGSILHLDQGSTLNVDVAGGGANYNRGVLVSQFVNTGIGSIFTSDPGSTVHIATHSDNRADGLYTIYNARSELLGFTEIETTGDESAGTYLYATPDSERLIISAEGSERSTISTSGTQSDGMLILQGHARIGRTDILTTGTDAFGIYDVGPQSSIVANDSTIVTTGSGAHGLVVFDGAEATGTGTTIDVDASDALGLLLVGDTSTQTASFSSGSITSPWSAIGVSGGIGNLTLDDMTVNGSIYWLAVTDADGLTLLTPQSFDIQDLDDLGNTVVRGSVSVSAPAAGTPATANITVRNSDLTGAAITQPGSISNVTLIDSLWTMTGSSNLTNLVNDPSLIQYTPPTGDPTLLSSYKTLTVTNYVGEGGAIGLNTYLGADDAPSDRLIIDGGAITGNSTLSLRNTTGPGALTTADGILVVDTINGATSVPTAFTLAGDYTTETGEPAVVAGAYAYTLNYGGVGANATDENWYLRSSQPGSPIPSGPLYQPGDPVYEAYPEALLALNALPTMQERVGNRYWQEPAAPAQVFCKDPSQNYLCNVTPDQASYYLDGKPTIESDAIWTRIDGQHGHFEPRTSVTGMEYDTDIFRLQAGLDGLLYEAETGGRLIGGVSLHYGRAVTDVDSVFGDGNIGTNGYGVGGTLTWLDPNGFYVDGQGSLTWLDSDLNSDTARRNLVDGNNGFGYALSVETGKKFDLRDGWTLTPQAQLAYANVRFDDFTDAFGARVSSGDSDSLIGRLGVSVDKDASWQDGTGKTRRSHLYGIANIYHEFLNASSVDVSGVQFESGPERLWGGVGVGGSYNWNDDKQSVYAEVSANTSLTSFGDSYSVSGTVGFRVKW
jgi:outer membrane autotransporter protein